MSRISDESPRRKPTSAALTSSSPASLSGAGAGTANTSSDAWAGVNARSGAHLAAWARSSWGNEVVSGSLAEDGGDVGLAALVSRHAAFEAAGIETDTLASNTAMLRAMRDAVQMTTVDQTIFQQAVTSSGRPLPAMQLDRMTQAFGHDFSHVRIHTDGGAARAAEALYAHAFALGADIFFGSGNYAPGTPRGDRLLAHELTHVVQFDQGRLPGSSGSDGEGQQVSNPSDPHELEAYGNEDRIAALLPQIDQELRAESSGGSFGSSGPEARVAADAGSEADFSSDAPGPSVGSVIDAPPSEDLSGIDLGGELGAGAMDSGLGALSPGEAGVGSADALPAGDVALRDVSGGSRRGAAPPGLADSTQTDGRSRAQDAMGRSRGAVIDPELGARMSALIGEDVTGAVLHTDPAAAEAAQALDAKAFALGADVFFDQGAFAPGTPTGDRLIAHELTHVAQDLQGRVPSTDGLEVSNPSDSLEREARQVGERAAAPGSLDATALPEAVMTRLALTFGVEGYTAPSAEQADFSAMDSLASALGAGYFGTDFGATTTVHAVGVEDSGLALRDTSAPNTGSEATGTGLPVPEELRFLVAAQEVVLDAKRFLESLPCEVTIPINLEPIAGLKLVNAELKFEADASLKEGKINAELKIGDFEAQGGVVLEVDEEFNVSASINSLHMEMDGVEATASVTLSSQGIEASLETHITEPVALHDKIKLTEASLSGKYADDHLHLEGALVLNFNEWAEGRIEATYDVDTSAEGVDQNLDLTEGSEATPAGEGGEGAPAPAPAPEAAEEGGESTEGESTPETESETGSGVEEGGQQDGESRPAPIRLDLPGGGTWGATGTVTQIKELKHGDITVRDSKLTIAVRENVLQPVQVESTIDAPHITGNIKGQWDVAAEALHGIGTVDLTEPLRLDELGVTIESLHAEAHVEANNLKSIKGALKATLDFEEQPTFTITGEELEYKFAEKTFSGTGTVTLLRTLTFGDPEGARAEIQKDASASAKFEEGRLTSVDGALAFKVSDKEGELGAGEVTLKWAEKTDGIDAEGTFALTTKYGVPERETGPLYFLEGSTLTAKITGGKLDSATLTDVKFELLRPPEAQEEGSGGKIEGNMEGTYTFAEGKTTGEGHASLTEAWPYELPWGKLTLDVGGQVDVKVTESKYEEIAFKVPFTADVTKGLPFTLKGSVDGNLDGETYKYTGKVKGALESNLDIPLGEGAGKLSMLKGSEAEGDVAANELQTITFAMQAQYYDAEDELYLEGKVEEGKYDLTGESGKMSFKAGLTLMKDIERSSESGDLTGKVLRDAKIDLEVADNNLTRMGGEAGFEVHDKEGLLLEGSVKNLDIAVKDKWATTGDLNVKTGRDLDFPRSTGGEGGEGVTGTTFELRVLKASEVNGRMEKSEITSVTGDLKFQVLEGEAGALAEGKLHGDWNVKEDKFGGSGNLKLIRDYELGKGEAGEGGRLEGWSTVLEKDSEVAASMKDNKLQEATVDVKVKFLKGEEQIAKGNITGQYTLGQEAGFTGGANVEMTKALDWASDSRFTYSLTPPTKVSAQAVESNLKSATGTFVLKAKEGETEKIELTAETTYESGKGITAEAKVKVLDAIQVAESAPWKLYLDKDSGGNASLVNDDLKEIGGTLKLRADQDGKAKLHGDFTASYKPADGAAADITAKGNIEVVDDIGGEPTTTGYKYYVEPGTKAEASILKGSLEYISGSIKGRVEDESPFLAIEANGKYAKAEGGSKVDIDGKATLTRNKVIHDEDLRVTLLDKSGANIKVENNDLTEVGGNVKILIEDDKGKFVEGALEGKWTKAGGVDGKVSGKLLREIPMDPALGEYKFFVEKDSGGHAVVAQTALKEVGGTLKVRIDDIKGPFIKGGLEGKYVFGGDGFSGKGGAEVVREKQLGELAGQTLWVEPSTGARVEIAKNAITKLEGDVKLSLRDGEGEYVEVAFSGEYDVGASAFSGKGGAKVTRDKRLFGEATGYSFWLKKNEEAAASAEIKANKLTKVGGNVPFMVKDGKPEALLEGAAVGDYNPETGKFSGSGEVFLGRNVEYELGAGKIVFKKGSGGRGTVTDSRLDKLGGTLEVDIYNDQGETPLLAFKAEGEYDAVNNKILWVEGSATLKKPMEPLGANLLRIDSLTGRARVENNELKWAEGSGSFTVIPLNNMKGTIQAKYENRGGQEIYTGKGTLDFTLFNEPDKGRYMKGKIGAELLEGGRFKVKGDADYSMSKMIQGKVGVEMDEKLDPTINASMTVNKELIPGQDLFKLKIPLIPHTPVPIYGPIALAFGAQASMGLSTRPLTLQTTIGVSNWKPLSNRSTVPDFDAELALDWGLDFNALLAAYLSLELTAGIGSAGAGIRGEVGINAPLSVRPYGRLHGGADGFSGELGIGIKLEPTVVLRAVPFVYAQLTGFDMLRHDFPSMETDLGPLFSFEWGTKYTFGDTNRREENPTETQPSPPPRQSNVEHKEQPAMPAERTSAPRSTPGGPQLESGSEIAGSSGADRASEGGGQMAEMQRKIDDIKVLAEGLGAVGYLIGLIVDLITALSVAGPPGLVIMLAWKILKGDLTWDRLVEAVEKVVAAVEKAAEILRPYLPSWMRGVIDFFSGEQPSLLDAFFGADDKVRAEVRKGTHRDFPNDQNGVEMIAGFIDEMTDGVCGDDDEQCILILLEFAESRGQLHAVLNKVSGGADHLDYKLDGSESRQLRRLLDRNGVQYEKSFW